MNSKQLTLNSSQVTNSRYVPRNNQIWRRRSYNGQIFTTRESVDLAKLQIMPEPGKTTRKNAATGRVAKQQKDAEMYMPTKLLMSVLDALQHRPIAEHDSWHIFETIQVKLIDELDAELITTKQRLFELTYDTLLHFDRVAALRYASIRTQKVSSSDLSNLA